MIALEPGCFRGMGRPRPVLLAHSGERPGPPDSMFFVLTGPVKFAL
jgi:hypothetical protein